MTFPGRCLTLLSLAAVSACAQPSYTITVIPLSAGASAGTGQAINQFGAVVGNSPEGIPFVWRGRTSTPIGNKQKANAAAISSNELIAGASTVIGVGVSPLTFPAPVLQAATLDQAGALDLGIPLQHAFGNRVMFSQASGVNASGHVVGTVLDANIAAYAYFGFILSKGQASSLPLFYDSGPYGSFANAINDAGQVVGYQLNVGADGISNTGAVIWENGGVSPLPSIGTDSTIAYAISSSGVAAGVSYGSVQNAVLWKAGTMSVLGPGVAYGVNDQDIAVGQGAEGQATLYRFGTTYNLQDLVTNIEGWQLSVANGINNAGQIVGTGILNGVERGFVLTPVR